MPPDMPARESASGMQAEPPAPSAKGWTKRARRKEKEEGEDGYCVRKGNGGQRT